MNLLILFIILNAINVIVQTIKSILTINGGKTVAALANAIAYGFYTIIIIYMVCELPLYLKVLIIGSCNFIGVFVVKLLEEKMRKDKLWKIEFTTANNSKDIINILEIKDIPYSTIQVSKKYTLFYCYCATKEESAEIKKLINNFNCKYFVTECQRF